MKRHHFKPITFEISHIFLYWMVRPLGYIKRCLAHENSRSIYEWIVVKFACFLTPLSRPLWDRHPDLLLHLSKWYGPTNHSPYLSSTFKETITPLESSLYASSIKLPHKFIKNPRNPFGMKATPSFGIRPLFFKR